MNFELNIQTPYNIFSYYSYENILLGEEEEEERINNDTIINENKKIQNETKLIEKKTTEFESYYKDNENKQNFEEEQKLEENLIQLFINKENIYKRKEMKNKENKEKKKCGRKRKRDSDDKIQHNKYSSDNIRRKIKHLLIKYMLEFINRKILIKYNGNIGKGIFKKELQTINQSQISDATIEFNKNFLTKKIGDIFSVDISGRFTNYSHDFNKNLINGLINENDENIKNFFKDLFNLEFLQCLKHFRGEIKIDILEGLTCFNDIKNEITSKYDEDGEEYYNNLQYYLNNYEEIIKSKRARKSKNQS